MTWAAANGRIVVTAAKKYGVKAVGFDIQPAARQEFTRERQDEQRGETCHHQREEDIFTLDPERSQCGDAVPVAVPERQTYAALAKLKPGSRIVSHDFDMPRAKPVEVSNRD